jgi:hypothetical protein
VKIERITIKFLKKVSGSKKAKNDYDIFLIMYKFTDVFRRRMRKESSCKYHMNFQVTKLFIYKKKRKLFPVSTTLHTATYCPALFIVSLLKVSSIY